MKRKPPTSTIAIAVAARPRSGAAQSNQKAPNLNLAKPQLPTSLPDDHVLEPDTDAKVEPPEQPTETGGARNGCSHPGTLTNLRLSEIVVDSDLQSRAEVNMAIVGEYTERMQAGDKFPPIDVFVIDDVYHLAGGVHRHLAAQKAGLESFQVQVHQGNRTDAVKFAIKDNCAHGLPRTNKDKRRAVHLAIVELSSHSDHVIAEICKVSQPFVSELRRELKTDFGCAKRIGRDGKQRKMPKTRASSAPNEPALAEKPDEPTQGSAESAGEKDKPRTLQKSKAAVVKTVQAANPSKNTEGDFNSESRWKQFREVLEQEYANWPLTYRSIFADNLVTAIETWNTSASQPVQDIEVSPPPRQTQRPQDEATA